LPRGRRRPPARSQGLHRLPHLHQRRTLIDCGGCPMKSRTTTRLVAAFES
jgi:hypothetical protein